MIGENVVDLVPLEDGNPVTPTYRALAGGGPANVAVAAARLGSPVALIARIGPDVFGRQVRARLAACGVDGRHLVAAAEPSSLAVVTFDAERRASYDFWLTGAADWQWTDEELPGALDSDVTAVHVGSLAAFIEPGASAIERFVRTERDRGQVTISLDPNVRPAIIGDLQAARERVERLVRLAHLVKTSDEDVAALYPGRSVQECARSWLALGPSLVVITLGRDGSLAVTRSAELAVPAPLVEVLDTVGAGDAFSGALLHSLSSAGLLGEAGFEKLASAGASDLQPILTAATAAGALTCTRAGADPPTTAELATFLAG